MSSPAVPIRSFAASLCLAAVAGLPACSTAERAASFRRGEEIPLGIFSLRVSDWVEAPSSRVPLSSLRTPEGEKAIAVFVGWEGLDDLTDADRRHFVESFLEHSLELVDSEGFDADPVTAMPRDLYSASAFHLEASPEWVVIFHVWVDSGGYSLRVRHPDPDKEKFDVAVVPLG